MRKEDFFEIFGELDDDIVKKAETPVNKKINWKVWGALAACLCLVAGMAAAAELFTRSSLPIGGGGSPAGAWPEGVDPITASLAVYPADERVENVESATCEKIDEETACAVEGLGEHLPASLPDGISFHSASLYETTMKNGTSYALLRAFYTRGEVISSNLVDGETGESLPASLHDEFAVFVMNYKPATPKNIYQMGELQEFLSNAWDGSTFHFACGGVYIGFTSNGHTLSVDEILSILTSIT